MSSKGRAIPDEVGEKRNKYPNSFLFGVFCGVIMNMGTRMGTHEPLHARPFSYATTGLTMGFMLFYYDYWRRRSIEEVMYGE